MTESEDILRRLASRNLPQMHQARDPLARAIAKAIFIACGLALGGAALWLKANVAWQFVGK